MKFLFQFIFLGFFVFNLSSQNDSVNFPISDKFDTIKGTIHQNQIKSFIPKIELYKVENISSEIVDDLLIYNYNESNNFPANIVYKIKKDKHGFLWLATNKGVIKFDGNTFYKIELPDSINNSEVRALDFDHEGNVWFNVYAKALLKYDGHKIEIMNEIAGDVKLRDLFVSSDSTLWMGCDNGFSKFKNGSFTKYIFDLKKSGAQNFFAVINFTEDFNKNIWVGVFGHNILKIKGNTVKEYNLLYHSNLQAHYNLHKVPKTIHLNKNKILFCSRFSGLFLFENNTMIMNAHPRINFSANSTYTDMVAWQQHYYVSTNFGLLKFSDDLKTVKFIESVNISKHRINNLFEDENTLYLGKNDGFCIIFKTPIKKYPSVTSDITKILYKNNQIYFTTDKELFQLTDSITKLPIDLSKYSIGNNELMDIAKGRFLNVYKNSGFAIFVNGSNEIPGYYSDFNYDSKLSVGWNKNILPKNACSQAMILNDSLVITFGSYVICLVNINTSSLVQKHDFNDEIIKALQIHSSNKFIFTTTNILYEYNLDSNTHNEVLSIKNGTIQGITFHKNILWIYSSDGFIHQYDYQTKKLIKSLAVNDIQKYIINSITIIEDKLFLTSNGGIYYFNLIDFESNRFHLFRFKMNKNYIDNLNGNYSVDYNVTEKNIYFNYQNTLYSVPSNKIAKQNSISVLMPQLFVNNTDYSRYSNTKSTLILPYDSTELKIYFSAINDKYEIASRYLYILEGYDKSWNENSSTNFINYSNILPGTYTLKYKVISENGSESKTEAYTIIIAPPFWQTWWFRLIIIIIILLLIRWYFIYAKNKANKKLQIENEQLQIQNEIVELEQKLLLTQMNPHFIFNSINSIKIFVQQNDSKEAARYLSDFAALMRLILESSRKEFIALDDEIKILTYYMDLERLRLNQSFDYTINMDEETEEESESIQIPSMLLQPFIENAIKHGLENTSLKGKILLSFTCVNSNELHIEIEDNGLGINKAKELKNYSVDNHESFAMKITEERAAVFEKKYQRSISIKTSDLNTNDKNSTGTKINIVLPIIN